MDDNLRRNLLIEEHFPDGKAQSGFSYSFSKVDTPVNMVALEITMPGETLRLFFDHEYFKQFAIAASAVARAIT